MIQCPREPVGRFNRFRSPRRCACTGGGIFKGCFLMIDKKSYRLLKYVYKNHIVPYQEANRMTKHLDPKKPNEHIAFLRSLSFVKVVTTGAIPDGEGGWINAPTSVEITLQGIAYIESRRHSGIQFWVPYLITTFIALLSLIGTVADNWVVIQTWVSS